ncbi:MAG: MerR family transcriptional regulator [Acidimicrobiales bacterium]
MATRTPAEAEHPDELVTGGVLTIDELAAATGTTTRSIRSFQTLGLLPHPGLRGRTGIYRGHHLQRLRAILRLQAQGFSLQSLAALFAAHERGESLGTVLGLGDGEVVPGGDTETDEAELYGFGELERNPLGRRGRGPGRARPLLAIVPTTVWDETEAS